MISHRIAKTLSNWGDDPLVLHAGRWSAGKVIAELAIRVAGLVDAAAGNPDEAVCFVIRNRPAHLAALLGLVAAGRPIRLVNAFQSPEKIIRDLDGLDARLVVADRDDRAVLAGRGGAVILGALSAETFGTSDHDCGPCLHDVAIELTTSGTTGTPKRIGLSPSTLLAAIDDQARIAAEMGEAPPGRHLEAALIQYAPILHIAGLWTALQMGMEGRRLVLLEKFDAAQWVSAVKMLRLRMTGMSPPLLRMVLDLGPPPQDLASLVAIRCGSTALDVDTRDAFTARYAIPLLGVYGATEYAGVVASWSLADHHGFAATKSTSAGRLRGHVAEARVADPIDGHILPLGECGVLELRVPRVGEEWMRSSDLASIDSDGFLTLYGRTDSAIIRGGFKILPDQLVEILRRHDAVVDAVVVGLPDRRLGQIPAAAVELRGGAQVTEADIDRYMRDQVSAYQVPVRYRIVDRLPRTPSAKIILTEVVALFSDREPLPSDQ